MIVIGVIAILTAIVAPSLAKARNDAQRKKVDGELEMISSAVLKMAWDTGVWPNGDARSGSATDSGEIWDLTSPAAGLMSTDGSHPNWQGPYIREVPLDSWGNPYFFDNDYFIGGDTRVTVGSFGPNGNGRNVYDSDNIYVLLD